MNSTEYILLVSRYVVTVLPLRLDDGTTEGEGDCQQRTGYECGQIQTRRHMIEVRPLTAYLRNYYNVNVSKIYVFPHERVWKMLHKVLNFFEQFGVGCSCLYYKNKIY